MAPLVVKVGGSLYELPDLGMRLRRWLGPFAQHRILLVPGGGRAADVIRHYDRAHHLGDEVCHWLALQMLAINARFLGELLPGTPIVTSAARQPAPLAILDMHAFAQADELRAGHLPHTWDVTSDSLAVRVAHLAEAPRLILLKSVDWQGTDWDAAARAGVVDPAFPEAMRQAADVHAGVVNLGNNET